METAGLNDINLETQYMSIDDQVENSEEQTPKITEDSTYNMIDTNLEIKHRIIPMMTTIA